MDDGSLAEVIEDPADPARTLLAVYKNGRIRITDRLEHRGCVLVPLPRTAVGFGGVKLACGTMPYRSVVRLFYNLFGFIKLVVQMPAQFLVPVAAFALYTWFADRLPVAVYLSVIGLPQSGKSTLLEVLSMICRQSILLSDVSEAATYRVCTSFAPTLLFDEVDWDSSRTTALRQLLRAGTNRSCGFLRVSGGGWAFGPKVFGSLEAPPDAALNSRCVQVPMAEANKRELVRITDPRILTRASEIRQQLLQFRFAHFRSVSPAIIPGAEGLRPRSQDLLASLAAPLVGAPIDRRCLLEFFKSCHDPGTRESLTPTQDALVAVIVKLAHAHPDLSRVRIGGEQGSLAMNTNKLLRDFGERSVISDKAVGNMLTSLGFYNTHRTGNGWILWMDLATRERAHQLVKTYGNRYVTDADFERYSKTCPACQALDSE